MNFFLIFKEKNGNSHSRSKVLVPLAPLEDNSKFSVYFLHIKKDTSVNYDELDLQWKRENTGYNEKNLCQLFLQGGNKSLFLWLRFAHARQTLCGSTTSQAFSSFTFRQGFKTKWLFLSMKSSCLNLWIAGILCTTRPGFQGPSLLILYEIHLYNQYLNRDSGPLAEDREDQGISTWA